MIESRKTLLIMSALLLLALGVYLALVLIPKPEGYRRSQDEISLLSVNPVDVASAETVYGGEAHRYEQLDGRWYRDGAPADYGETDLRITCISYLYSDNLVSGGAADLGVYGLDAPVAEASFATRTGERHRVRFGIETVDQNSRYMMVDDRDDVYTVPSEVFDIIFATEKKGEEVH